MRKTVFCLLFALVTAFGCTRALYDTRCEHLKNPLGIESRTPRFSWKIRSDKKNLTQKNYRIIAASSETLLDGSSVDLWDSGVVQSDRTSEIVYAGKPLESGQEVFWKVISETSDGASHQSDPARFSIGITPQEWHAEWIGLDGFFEGETDTLRRTVLAARYLRKTIDVPKTVKKATVYISGVGLYELSLNGAKVGDCVHAPLCTNFEKRVFYNTFDVTESLQRGENAIGVILGNGRYFTRRTQSLTSPPTRNYGFPRMIFQMEIAYADGTTERVVSNESWKATPYGPIRRNNEYDGEHYDARMELGAWNAPGYDASTWMKVDRMRAPDGKLVAQMSEPIRVTDTIHPVSVKKIGNKYIFDMGQNMVGWVKLSAQAAAEKCDTAKRVTLHFSENVFPDGSIDVANIRDAEATDVYYFKGTGVETFEPKFVYHGFRYVELSGNLAGDPTLDLLEGYVIHDDLPLTGQFSCSNELVNRIYQNAYWGIRGNYNGVPTDCPQRDERLGWMGDRAANSLGESYVFNINTLYSKWLTDFEDSQAEDGRLPVLTPTYWAFWNDNITWPSSYIVCAELLRRQYGNSEPIRQHYHSMRKWMNMMRDEYMKENLMTKDTYGDWCMPPINPHEIHSTDPTRHTAGELLSSVYYVDLLRKMSGFSKIVGNEDYKAYDALAELMKNAINEKYLNKEMGYYANNTPTSNLIALFFDIVPEPYRDKVMDNIVLRTKNEYNSHICVGLIGMQVLMRTLSDNGQIELAFQLLNNRTYPSWGYMIDNGATTIWELWNGNTAAPDMNSGNHVMLLGDLVGWYYQYLGGIRQAEQSEAFGNIVLQPHVVGDLKTVNCSFDSPKGVIVSNWKVDGDVFLWEVEIPVNATAKVLIPCSDRSSVKEANQPISVLDIAEGYATVEIGSGKYNFTSRLQLNESR